MKFRIRHAEQVVGAFILLALAFLVAIMVFMGMNQRWFAKNYAYQSTFSSANGLAPGTGIFMKGFQIGKIDSLRLNDQNLVDVSISIFDTYRAWVKKNSVLEFVTSPIGLGSQLLFYPGNNDVPLPEGSAIASYDFGGKELVENGEVVYPPRDDSITRLLASLTPTIENINKTVLNLNKTILNINAALAGKEGGPVADILLGLKGTVADLGSAAKSAGSIVGDVGKSVDSIATSATGLFGDLGKKLPEALDGITGNVDEVTAKVVEVLASVDRSMKNVEELTKALSDPTGLVTKLLDPKGSIKTILDDGGALYGRIDAALAGLDATLKNIADLSKTLAGEAPKIMDILSEAKTAIVSMQDVLEGLKNNPLLKGGIPEKKPQSGLYESFREEDF